MHPHDERKTLPHADNGCKVDDNPANRSTDMAKKKRKQTPKRKPRPQAAETPVFFLARQGHVQRLSIDVLGDGEKRKCWPVATTHEDAMRLIDFYGCRAEGVRPAQIGSVPGETVAGHCRMAIDEGCHFLLHCVGWTGDGKPMWKIAQLVDDRDAT
jgi:hypothetical protein